MTLHVCVRWKIDLNAAETDRWITFPLLGIPLLERGLRAQHLFQLLRRRRTVDLESLILLEVWPKTAPSTRLALCARMGH